MEVNPEILSWARTTAGLDLPAAAARLGFRDTLKRSAEEKLTALEAGEAPPSRPVLLKMATVYRRPLISFYVSRPPKRAGRGEDFRTLPEGEHIDSAAAIDALARDIRARQDNVKALLEEEGALAISTVGASRLADGAETVATHLADWLTFDLATFRRGRTIEAAFTHLRAKVEEAGVFVLLMGNPGSDHGALHPEAFCGFALADPIAPFIVINDQDAEVSWAFTLLYELAHIAIGATGISGGVPESAVETFCSEVAGELLLPRRETARFTVSPDSAALRCDITEFAVGRHVSRQMVAHRLYLTGRLTWEQWQEVSRQFRNEYLREGRERWALECAGDVYGYFTSPRHRLGNAMLQFVRRHLADGRLTPARAGRILGVKPRDVEPLLSGASG